MAQDIVPTWRKGAHRVPMRTMQTEVLGERYKLQDPIGRGGMATIYRGQDLRMDRVVAIKVLREVYSTDPKFVTRFQREAKAASALQHPNIVQVYDYGQTDGNYFIVMELVEGTDLRRYLRSRGVLAVDRAIIIAHDVALGLGAAHRRGIVHRDVKPQNVLVGRDGSIKLTDFGIASVYKDINAERPTTTGMTLGTVQYYAPEQAQGEIVSPAADVYALGIVMYEMLTGRTPFDGDTPVAVAMQHIQDIPLPPSHMNPNIPPALEEVILRCLEKEPGTRFPDGSQLARALEMLGDAKMSETVSMVHHLKPHRTLWSLESIITTSILLATLFLLCFSLYLAVQLHFIHVPFFTASRTPPSPTAGFIEVPDLHTMSWLHAVATSEKSGFRLVLVEGQPNGVVVDQNPRAHDKAAKDSTIDVKLEILAPKIGLQFRNPTCMMMMDDIHN